MNQDQFRADLHQGLVDLFVATLRAIKAENDYQADFKAKQSFPKEQYFEAEQRFQARQQFLEKQRFQAGRDFES